MKAKDGTVIVGQPTSQDPKLSLSQLQHQFVGKRSVTDELNCTARPASSTAAK